MGVYIKGFPLPNNCSACPLRLAWCRERIYMVTRPERCPLIPVSEHGRLIDADALMANAEYKGRYDILTAYDVVAAPTIIPASTADKKGEI